MIIFGYFVARIIFLRKAFAERESCLEAPQLMASCRIWPAKSPHDRQIRALNKQEWKWRFYPLPWNEQFSFPRIVEIFETIPWLTPFPSRTNNFRFSNCRKFLTRSLIWPQTRTDPLLHENVLCTALAWRGFESRVYVGILWPLGFFWTPTIYHVDLSGDSCPKVVSPHQWQIDRLMMIDSLEVDKITGIE